MRHSAFVFVAICALAAVVGAQPSKIPPGVQDVAILVTTYHHKPDPQKAAAVFDKIIADKLLDDPFMADSHRMILNEQAFGHMARQANELTRKYETAFPIANDTGRNFILGSLAICGDAKSKALVEQWQADPKYAGLKTELAATHKALSGDKRELPRDKAANTPDELDLLWVDFLITGEYAPISRILDVLDRPANTKDELTLRRVAIWSAKSNMHQHPKMAELVAKHQADRPKGPNQSGSLVKDWLDELKNGPQP